MLDICVVGCGAVGTIYSLILERSTKAQVTVVARSNYELVSSQGIDVFSDLYGTSTNWKPYRVVRSPEEASDREYAFVICTFKCLPDVVSTPTLLGPLLQRSKSFVLIQNGIGIHQGLQEAVSSDTTIISGSAWIATTLHSSRIVKHGNFEKLVVGLHGSRTEASQASLDLLVQLLRGGGGNPAPTAQMEAERWKKNLWNAALSTMATLTRLNLVDLLREEGLPLRISVVRSMMQEVLEVAYKLGISPSDLPQSAIDEAMELTLNAYGPGKNGPPFKPSMLMDLEAGRPMELEAILGGVVRYAKELDVATPRLDMAYTCLRAVQEQLLHKGAII